MLWKDKSASVGTMAAGLASYIWSNVYACLCMVNIVLYVQQCVLVCMRVDESQYPRMPICGCMREVRV